ncbi:MAG TPA: glycosyltransferase family 4 protein [Ideonella sp.]|uniref:glycosyltransferase family 4 protein n=1 Tax=Ideonella sp. TaxID=1929293 RepID=UPI002B7BB8EF|nr:glycosyltransferase family 4 protein [Ideonella sp.]HSI48407.1 glycosyltransferase family 4 protein [Ideonella sp.]
MNILYLNHYAGSPELGMEYRPYYLAREWVRAGHAVTMLAASFSHVRAKQPKLDPNAGADGTRETIDGIAYRWFDTPAYQGNGMGRMRNIASFLAQVWQQADALVAELKPQVVIASSTYPMDIWIAQRLARKAGAKLVFEVHDLWPLSPIELSGMSPWHPFALICSSAERAAYRDADVVVSMLPKVHEHMASRGLDLKKLVIVPNGISPEEWDGRPEPLKPEVAACIGTAHKAGRHVIGYAGSMGRPNALDTLLDGAKLLADSPVEFVLVGDGHERERLVRRIEQEGLSARVHWCGTIPKAQIPSFLGAIEVAYIGWQRVPIYRFGIAPNKLMDYMMAGCPVLHAVEAGNDPVAEAGAGITVPPESPEAVAEGIKRLLCLPAATRKAMGRQGRAFVLAEHAYPVLAKRFLAACTPPAPKPGQATIQGLPPRPSQSPRRP